MEQQYSFGTWLRLRRKALDLTREALANRVGCSAATIRKLEAEERRPSVQIAERLVEIFNLPTEEYEAFLRFARYNAQVQINERREKEPWKLSGVSPRSNLPSATTSLIGRAGEIALVREYLLSNERRLITLIGPPGIGKTRLSQEIGRGLLPNFAGGVFFVELAELDDAALAASTIVQALGFVERKHQSIERELVDGIGDRGLLLILDNCEHLIEGIAPLVIALLQACPRLKILATSREALRVPGEWLYPVPALGIPRIASGMDLETVGKSSAVSLFVERVRAVRPDFTLEEGNLQPIVSICAQLDGLPLAIELVAARMRLMSPQAVLEHLTDGFVLSADGKRAVSARQKTLGNAIDWSYKLLTLQEQRLFACLGVFSGGFTFKAAEDIFLTLFSAALVTSKSISDLILSLLDKSMLQRTFDEQGEVRFNMLVTIRRFALNCLRTSGIEEEARSRHLEYFLELAEKGASEMRGPSQVDWGRRLESEHDNFRAALEWSLLDQKSESAIRLLGALGWSWEIHGHYSEARNWFEKIRTLPEATQYPVCYARLLNHLGRQNWTQERYSEAQSLLEASRAVSLSLGAEGEQILAETLNWLGMTVLFGNNDRDLAGSLLNSGLDLYRRLGDQYGVALSIFHLGILASDFGQQELALSLYEQSHALFRQVGDLFFIARVSLFLGHEYLKIGSHETARFFFEEHLRLDQELQFWDGIADGWRDLGYLACAQGEYDRAEKYYNLSLTVSSEHGLHMSDTLYSSGLLALRRGNYLLVENRFNQLVKLGAKQENAVTLSRFLLGLAIVAGINNQFERAVRLSAMAQTTLEAAGEAYPPDEFKEFVPLIRTTDEWIDESALDALRTEGRAMTIEQAIAYARQGISGNPLFRDFSGRV